jgi:hypothetical protein
MWLRPSNGRSCRTSRRACAPTAACPLRHGHRGLPDTGAPAASIGTSWSPSVRAASRQALAHASDSLCLC